MRKKFSGGRRFRPLDSPIGRLTIVVEDGALVGVYTENEIHSPIEGGCGIEDITVAGDVAAQLDEYFAGRRKIFDFDTPLRLQGTTFQQEVWHAISSIKFGDTMSYGQVADSLNNPLASRAVGTAAGKNPISIVIPCHRVVGSDNSLGGYAGGLDMKKWLLRLEGSLDANRPEFVKI